MDDDKRERLEYIAFLIESVEIFRSLSQLHKHSRSSMEYKEIVNNVKTVLDKEIKEYNKIYKKLDKKKIQEMIR